ncbi:hypothetical protein T484DRAFT_1916634 [Baffinella frigidus]|nr:hypothetical protein T484DRAFT_1916634 [Cryptophyta sp. CCMP2293]
MDNISPEGAGFPDAGAPDAVAMDMDTPMPMPPVEQDAIVQRGAGFNRRVSRPLPRLDDDGQGLGF